ncbi:MAG: thioredoxin domain-containing protein [Bryobacterales bacterium]|nr:thioredoxin domain-containing protein [Bryobacterales bacterium]
MPVIIPPLIEGDAGSAVRVIVYEDLQCKDCAWLRRKLDAHLLPAFGNRAGFEYRDFPLPTHAWARRAAMASKHFQRGSAELAIGFRREVLGNLSMVTEETLPAWISAFAARHGQDTAEAGRALDDAALAAAVQSDYQSGIAMGIAKTPTVLVAEVRFVEYVPTEELMAAIRHRLEVCA